MLIMHYPFNDSDAVADDACVTAAAATAAVAVDDALMMIKMHSSIVSAVKWIIAFRCVDSFEFFIHVRSPLSLSAISSVNIQ